MTHFEKAKPKISKIDKVVGWQMMLWVQFYGLLKTIRFFFWMNEWMFFRFPSKLIKFADNFVSLSKWNFIRLSIKAWGNLRDKKEREGKKEIIFGRLNSLGKLEIEKKEATNQPQVKKAYKLEKNWPNGKL